mmetsp:Transcript_23266/g.22849  ORF Transcript_23266/g.22849 Transcript_23266/m.22849 type:complete len:82 (-) Transcript_23266:524-769(-)
MKISNQREKEEEKSDETLYVVYANINSSDEDFSFILTALYHWENMYPTFTLELPKDPEEIVVKEKAKEEEKLKEALQEPAL